MRLYFLTTCLFFVSTVSLSQNKTRQLKKAYKRQSTEKLDAFFKNWTRETPALSNQEINDLNDTLRNVYSVFQAFYWPKDLEKIGGSEWGNDIYKNVKFLVLQNEIKYESGGPVHKNEVVVGPEGLPFSIDLNPDGLTNTVKNFRPQISAGSARMVVLTPDYRKVLTKFLGKEHRKMGAGNIMSPAGASGKSRSRQAFLENFIKIFHGHWGGYWELYSFPTVQSILFDQSQMHAILQYTMVYEGGNAYLTKKDGSWTVQKVNRIWIE